MARNVMLDLETLGVRPGCSVLAIGAVDFSAAGVGRRRFYRVVSRASCAAWELREEKAALDWWSRQGKGAREVLRLAGLRRAPPLERALAEFARYFRGVGPDVLVWGNGADFDKPILEAAYAAAGMEPPWRPYAGRCYRTLKNMRPDLQPARKGVAHNALDDARTQASHAVALAAALGIAL